MYRRFRQPKSNEEELSFLEESVPRNTRFNTKWTIKIFEEWQASRSNKTGTNDKGGDGHDGEFDYGIVDDLTVPLAHMSPNSVSFWLSKFICEVVKRDGQRYPAKSVYLMVCGLNRYLAEAKGEEAFNILGKSDNRYVINSLIKIILVHLQYVCISFSCIFSIR